MNLIIKHLFLFYFSMRNLNLFYSVQQKKILWGIQRKTLRSIINLPLFLFFIILSSPAYSQTHCEKAINSTLLPTVSELALIQGQGLVFTFSSSEAQTTLRDLQWLQKGRFESLRKSLEKFGKWENKSPMTLVSLLKITHNKKSRINYQSHELFQKKYAKFREENKETLLFESHPKRPIRLSFDAAYDFTTQVVKLVGPQIKLRDTETIFTYDRAYIGYHPSYPLPSETFPAITIHPRQNFLEVEMRFELAKNLFLFIYYTESRPHE